MNVKYFGFTFLLVLLMASQLSAASNSSYPKNTTTVSYPTPTTNTTTVSNLTTNTTTVSNSTPTANTSTVSYPTPTTNTTSVSYPTTNTTTVSDPTPTTNTSTVSNSAPNISKNTTTVPFPKSVVNYMGTRDMRNHHFVWHNIRNLWNKLNATTQDKIRKLGWEPPRPALRYDSEGTSYAIENNTSGEDFLYMHRQMIKQANKIIKKNKDPYGPLAGWESIPTPSSESYPVPPNYTITNNSVLTKQLTIWKGNNIYDRMVAVEKTMKDPVQLRNMTLGELGARIEFTIHNWAHMRFSNISEYGYRSKGSNPVPQVDSKWDNLTYNWLGDNYGSHLNPLFWKIHGWVDDRIEDWRKANNISTIKWKGTWTGGSMSKLPDMVEAVSQARILNQDSNTVASTEDMDMNDMDTDMDMDMDMDGMSMGSPDVLEELVKVLSECGEESHFYDPILSSDVHEKDEYIVSLKSFKKTTTVKRRFRSVSSSKKG